MQQPTSDIDSAASKASVDATAIAEAMWQATGTNPIVTRSLCNAHPVKAAVATVDVKFETDGASGADVEVALEAVAAEAEFKEEATAEVTNNVAKATVMEANFTTVGANSVSIYVAASDQVGLQIASEMNSSRLVVLLLLRVA